MQSII